MNAAEGVDDLVAHLEAYLGSIEGGSQSDRVTIAEFRAPPTLPNCMAFSTLGVSQHALTSERSEKRFRLEFVMLVRSAQGPGPLPSLLADVGNEAIESHSALLRGDVVGPRGPIAAGSALEALYAAVPVYLPDSFASVGDIALVWLVPISHAEAHIVFDKGWDAFEALLHQQDPDLTDLYRSPVL